jgi:hypothetical protein
MTILPKSHFLPDFIDDYGDTLSDAPLLFRLINGAASAHYR